MMKSVLISIQPKWCDLIARGLKTVEVRKTRPKLETPFKCYIYCTVGRMYKRTSAPAESVYFGDGTERSNGKVIGEFVCDWIDENTPDILIVKEDREKYTAGSCLTAKEIRDYLRGNKISYNLSTLPYFYCWHISELKIYDKPKMLSEFNLLRGTKFGFEPVSLKRAPQSWCYVEEQDEDLPWID